MKDYAVAAMVLTKEIEALRDIQTDEMYRKVQAVVNAIRLCSRNGGNVLVSGAGKSGIVGQKFVGTLKSFGIRAFVLDAGTALHGDLGCVREEDVLILISKSGEADELIRTAKYCGKGFVALTSSPDSWLARNASLAMVIPMKEEADLLNMAPTASTTVYMAVCDMIAVCLQRDLSQERFVQYHPAGAIGRQVP